MNTNTTTKNELKALGQAVWNLYCHETRAHGDRLEHRDLWTLRTAIDDDFFPSIRHLGLNHSHLEDFELWLEGHGLAATKDGTSLAAHLHARYQRAWEHQIDPDSTNTRKTTTMNDTTPQFPEPTIPDNMALGFALVALHAWATTGKRPSTEALQGINDQLADHEPRDRTDLHAALNTIRMPITSRARINQWIDDTVYILILETAIECVQTFQD
ncbi:MAG: hypothetical protein LBK95_11905 [Bifidobacteriaceae bacterium]|jgi:hypothetical protein|nr:hypothetical protein [Bifidobacteriaceae bacterium]